ncbi:universal stress protein [Hydrogenophaga crocea]|uniref:Universal stress protein n=1 Tax=Hydrogenophaga crocea TaxID=2716225 RepID=A0A6G8IM56_9BURK|nr:universal stress protein [Hydrogenophaga crocea]QIM54292.1 universal stress protein [Hydrogenophaga crocea]
MHKVLIPIDGSPEALAAVHHVLQLVGQGLRLRCVLANVQESASLYEVVTAPDPAVLQRVADGAGRDLLKPAQQLLAAAGVAFEQEVVQTGEVAQALLDVAERHGVHAIVMGAGASGLGDRVLGSVSLDLVRAAPVPITVVRARG